ncbi:MAG: bifunctional protein-serine/threonine kinase/phosphatase [Epsilonproteobacteria bacterium]|nr:bifunctional protein-serine/threonine kinase/phosphatase [Campylobacterota bacterium]
MARTKVKTSGFSLAKGKMLTGDDFYEVKTFGNLTVAVVCDGVGSAAEGAAAAKRVSNYLISNFKRRPKSWSIEKSILSFIQSINEILYKESLANYERSELVTTLAMVVIQGERLYGANVGDSRVYLLRDNTLNQLSKDHAMDEKGYENVLTQAIGIDQEVEPFYFENIIQENDKLLLCSDGLYNVLSEDILTQMLELGAHALVKKASKLTEDDLPDDTTAIVLDIQEIDATIQMRNQNIIIPKTLKAGDDIDGYILEESLIQNERTWLATKKTKQYVLKFAPHEAVDDEQILDLFIKEAWNAKRLKSPYFPKAVIPKNRTMRYYVMQYIPAETLAQYMQHRTLSIEDVIKLGVTLLQMSQFLVGKDLVHGDIKPENILIIQNEDEDIAFKVIDFGSITEIFATDSKAGTPSYLSPQRFAGEAINESSEIFAIGVTLYQALTSKYPYGEIEPFQTPSFKEAQLPSKYNKNIPPWLDSVVLRSIAIEKEKRYEHFSEMVFEITHPEKVRPYFKPNATLIEKDPAKFYRIGFTIMTILNMILFGLLLR